MAIEQGKFFLSLPPMRWKTHAEVCREQESRRLRRIDWILVLTKYNNVFAFSLLVLPGRNDPLRHHNGRTTRAAAFDPSAFKRAPFGLSRHRSAPQHRLM